MELRVLRYFLMVAREENITKAADLLHVTQPTLSRQLMQLEEELDCKLFTRGQHSIKLTDDGMLLKRRAQEIVALEEKTKQEFSREEGTLSGIISIGSGETQSMHTLSGWMTAFRKFYPMVQFSIYSANADDIKDRIENGLLDIGLLMEPVEISKYNFIRLPKKEQWGILTRKDSLLATKTEIRPQDLLGTPLLLSRRSTVQNELANWFGSCFDEIEIAATYNLISNTAIMVQDGVGTALCFRHESQYRELCFIPLAPALETGAVLVWKKQQAFSPATSQFITFLQKCSKDISRNSI